MPLALFDLDNTLLAGDSDFAWGQFIVTKGLVDAETYAEKNQQFYREYQDGTLDAYAYQQFCIAPLKGKSPGELAELHSEFMQTAIAPMWLTSAEELIDRHRREGHRLVVITATNRFIVEPIVAKFGVDNLICSEPDMRDGIYTGELLDEPCMGPGKVSKLARWMQTEGESLSGSIFYSDSHNDLPLLNRVDHPIAVDPDERLRATAAEHNWPIISLR